jgi:hypothetical protein
MEFDSYTLLHLKSQVCLISRLQVLAFRSCPPHPRKVGVFGCEAMLDILDMLNNGA